MRESCMSGGPLMNKLFARCRSTSSQSVIRLKGGERALLNREDWAFRDRATLLRKNKLTEMDRADSTSANRELKVAGSQF